MEQLALEQLALMIAKYEKPPADPYLLLAREYYIRCFPYMSERAMKEAVHRCFPSLKKIQPDDYDQRDWSTSMEQLALMIAKYEKPPVDPVILRARELYAEKFSFFSTRKAILDGNYDENIAMRALIRALKEGMGNGK